MTNNELNQWLDSKPSDTDKLIRVVRSLLADRKAVTEILRCSKDSIDDIFKETH